MIGNSENSIQLVFTDYFVGYFLEGFDPKFASLNIMKRTKEHKHHDQRIAQPKRHSVQQVHSTSGVSPWQSEMREVRELPVNKSHTD